MAFEPFIVTAELPPDLLAWADALRRDHYPPERNHLAAHVTLFHSLAPSLRGELPAVLARMAGEYAAPAAELTGLMNLGKGTALALSSPAMLAIRAEIANLFHGMLTAQDQHNPRLHITIQNKVMPNAARALQAELQPVIVARKFAFTGLGLHRYCNPHWEAVGVWPFRGKVSG
ncbi:MAG: 2'-5' RNA ligase family protein [Sphingomonadaceae bacterium]|nr:2'-5' RNA ligase family protein [Sphingomonadaceae bacterium]